MATMNDALYDDDLKLLQSSFRKWLQTEVLPHHDQWEKNHICPREIYKKAGAQGFLLVNQSPEYGGQGLDFRFSAIITEELALAGATGLPLWLHSDIIAPYIEHFGTEAQKKKYLPKMATGEIISAIAMTEPGTGSDLQGMETTAIQKGDQWILNGAKTFISNGLNCDLVIVAAKTPSEKNQKYTPLTLFLVEANTPGFTKGRSLEKIGLKAQDTAELSFSDCKIPKENILGEAGRAFLYLTQNLPTERLCMAIHCVATARRALELTIPYVKSRKAFGKSISDFQNTRHKLAEISAEIEVCQAFVDLCIQDLNAKKDISQKAAIAKLKCSEMLDRAADTCLQLFGGYGYMLEYPISKLYTDSRAQRIFGGTSEIMKEIIAKSVLE